jgi:acetyl esterase
MSRLDPDMQRIIDRLAALPFRPFSELGPIASRAQDAALFDPLWNRGDPEVARVIDLPLATDLGALPVRLYDPGLKPPAPALIYLHGGGFVLGGLQSHDSVCRHLALASRCVVIAIDYPLAPEHRFPLPLMHCASAAHAIAMAAGSLGLDATRLAIAGDSAGANLAFATLRALTDARRVQLRCAVLIYGMFDTRLSGPSHRLFGDGKYLLSADDLAFFWRQYLAAPADWDDPRALALRAPVAGLPPILVTAAEFDPLLDDSRAMFDRLRAADAAHEFRLWPGLVHAALNMASDLPAMRAHLDDIGRFLRANLAPVISRNASPS